MARDPAVHYDRVTDAWLEFMGDNLHFGYFATPDMELAEAARAMIDRMLALCDLSGESRVLDVGCGVGAPALYIHGKYGCAVEGISTSERGVRLAAESARQKGIDKVRFTVADGMDNGFPDSSFDLVWIMEAVHPVQDKRALFRECHRVLRGGGRLVLCDLAQLGSLPFLRGLRHFLAEARANLFAPDVWGPARVLSMGSLCDLLVEAGFARIRVVNITEKVLPTLPRWRENALRFRDRATEAQAARYADAFARACTGLEKAFNEGLMGYGMIRAEKEI
ncbi:MAG: methyltransferase domain-containing protein [Actinobacteria bacterium]|nr:methyltransferase domain-containing protein [Actinomycetota bacterium]